MCNVISKVKIILLSCLISFALSVLATAADFTYKIVEANRLGTIKCDLTVRLSKKVSEETLRQLAIELRTKEPKKYDKMFITYYLPGMTIGAGAWATTHFNPNLDVRILGMTIEQERKLLREKTKVSGKTIGVWADELGKITIIKKGSGHIIEKKYEDGSGSKEDLISYKVRGKPAFKVRGDDLGEYYVIERSGELGVYDSLGLITTKRAIK